MLRYDRTFLQQTGVVFDGLHALLSNEAVKKGLKTETNEKHVKE